MTAIHVEPRIANLIAEGKVTQHRARMRLVDTDWRVGQRHAIVPLGRRSICHVHLTDVARREVGELAVADMRALGHKTRAGFARAWLRQSLPKDRVTSDDEVVELFERRAAIVLCWVLTFTVDREHEPRLLHEDPARNYTPTPHQAASGEGEAVSANDIEAWTEAAEARHAAHIGLLHQQDIEARDGLAARLARVQEVSSRRGIDTRSDLRVIERTLAAIERRLAGHAMREAG